MTADETGQKIEQLFSCIRVLSAQDNWTGGGAAGRGGPGTRWRERGYRASINYASEDASLGLRETEGEAVAKDDEEGARAILRSRDHDGKKDNKCETPGAR